MVLGLYFQTRVWCVGKLKLIAYYWECGPLPLRLPFTWDSGKNLHKNTNKLGQSWFLSTSFTSKEILFLRLVLSLVDMRLVVVTADDVVAVEVLVFCVHGGVYSVILYYYYYYYHYYNHGGVGSYSDVLVLFFAHGAILNCVRPHLADCRIHNRPSRGCPNKKRRHKRERT